MTNTIFVCSKELVGQVAHWAVRQSPYAVPAGLEAALAAVPAIKPGRAVVFSIPDERVGSDQIVVLYEAAEGEPEDGAAIQATERAVRALLAERFAVNPVHVGRLPPGTLRKTTSGKISRALNRAAFLQAGGQAAP